MAPAALAPQNAVMQDRQVTPSSVEDSIPAQKNGSSPTVRLFVGGLPPDVTASELQARFKPFGTVLQMEVVPQKGEPAGCRGFAYVDLVPVSEATLHKCFTVYNGAKWRGGKLRVEKARATFLDRLSAEWAAEREGPTKANEEPVEGQTKQERLDTAKQLFEPLRLKWGAWEFEKRTKVVPAARGAKIKKSFRNVPEKSLWELEGVGGGEALFAQKAGTDKASIHMAADSRGASQEARACVKEASIEAQSADISARAPQEKGCEKAHTVEEDERNADKEDGGGIDNASKNQEDRETDGDGGEVSAEVRELTPWEKLMQKAAAGHEEDDFLDDEMGSLEDIGTAAEPKQDLGRFRGAGSEQEPAQEKVEVQNNPRGKAGSKRGSEGAREGETEEQGSLDKMLQETARHVNSEENDEMRVWRGDHLVGGEGPLQEDSVCAEVRERQTKPSSKHASAHSFVGGAGKHIADGGRGQQAKRMLENTVVSVDGFAKSSEGMQRGGAEKATENLTGAIEKRSLGGQASRSDSDVSERREADVSDQAESIRGGSPAPSEETGRTKAVGKVNKDAEGLAVQEDDVRQGDADVSMVSKNRKGLQTAQLNAEEGALASDFEVAPAGDSSEEDPMEADGQNGVRTPVRTLEDEDIARQLAEERRRQLGLLGAMFPDDARFFSEEPSQRPQPRSGFLPVARYDPSATEAPNKTGDPNKESQPEEDRRQDEEVAKNEETEAEKARGQADEKKSAAISSRVRETGGLSRKRKAESESDAGHERMHVADIKSKSVPKKRHLVKEGGAVIEEAPAEIQNGSGRGKGDTAVGMVSEVVAQLSPQVLKFLDPALLQQLVPGVKEKESGRVPKPKKQNLKRHGQLENGEVAESTRTRKVQNESGVQDEGRASRVVAGTGRKQGQSAQEEFRKEGRAPEQAAENAFWSSANPPPPAVVQVDGKAGLSLEERKRLKREKRDERRQPELVRNSVKTQADPPGPGKEVKQEVFVNPNWRALVGYVGNEKPTFSLSSVLPQVDVALPEPSNVLEAPESTDPELPPHADISQALNLPKFEPASGAMQSTPKPIVNDEEAGLSFVRSENAEKEWLLSKSALAIDYKRKKRVASRVAPKAGAKRRG